MELDRGRLDLLQSIGASPSAVNRQASVVEFNPRDRLQRTPRMSCLERLPDDDELFQLGPHRLPCCVQLQMLTANASYPAAMRSDPFPPVAMDPLRGIRIRRRTIASTRYVAAEQDPRGEEHDPELHAMLQPEPSVLGRYERGKSRSLVQGVDQRSPTPSPKIRAGSPDWHLHGIASSVADAFPRIEPLHRLSTRSAGSEMASHDRRLFRSRLFHRPRAIVTRASPVSAG